MSKSKKVLTLVFNSLALILCIAALYILATTNVDEDGVIKFLIKTWLALIGAAFLYFISYVIENIDFGIYYNGRRII